MKDRLLLTLLAIFFLSPLCILFYYFKINIDIPYSGFFLALKNSLIQSITAALICVSAGLLLAPGLSRLKNKWVSSIYNLSLLPSMLPSLFTLLIVFSFFKNFPFGHRGVIFVFVVTYLGFAVVATAHAYSSSIAKYSALLEIYQIKGWARYLRIYLPLIKKDLFNVFLIILVGCFSSLSIPLLASGGRGINVEVFIYELIYISGNWGAAVAVSVLQLTTIFIMSSYLSRQKNTSTVQIYSLDQTFKKMNLSLAILISYIGLYIFGYFFQVIKAVINLEWQQFDLHSFIMPMSRSLILAGFTILLFLSILTLITYFIYKKINYYHLFYFMLPSTTLVGFSLYLVFPEQPSIFVDVLKIAIAMNLVYSLVLFKSYVLPEILNIESQFNIARIYGISFLEVFKNVILPQIKKSLFICINIIFIFSFCDFALIKSAGAQTLFSGVFIERLISTYRLELGFIYSSIVLVGATLFMQVTRFLNVKD